MLDCGYCEFIPGEIRNHTVQRIYTHTLDGIRFYFHIRFLYILIYRSAIVRCHENGSTASNKPRIKMRYIPPPVNPKLGGEKEKKIPSGPKKDDRLKKNRACYFRVPYTPLTAHALINDISIQLDSWNVIRAIHEWDTRTHTFKHGDFNVTNISICPCIFRVTVKLASFYMYAMRLHRFDRCKICIKYSSSNAIRLNELE